METSYWTVFNYAMLTALATGLGALPFLFRKEMPDRWLGIANAIAAGLMLTASFSLIYEGSAADQHSFWRVIVGMLLGLVFIVFSDRILERQGDLDVSELKGADARKALLIIGVMTLHSFTEGVGVGVSFGGGQQLGEFITAAIALHNVPEGLAIALVCIPRGMKVWQAAMWSVVSSLPQPLMAVPAYAFVDIFRPFLPVGLGFAAGAMIWMVFSELVNDANEKSSPGIVGITVTLSVAAMLAFQQYM